MAVTKKQARKEAAQLDAESPSPKLTIVLINGPAQTGKNYFANDLAKSLGTAKVRSRILEFKEPLIEHLHILRIGAMVVNGGAIDSPQFSSYLDAQYEADKMNIFDSTGLTGREHQIAVADLMRANDPNVFIKSLANRIRSLKDKCKIFLVPDWGFENEYWGIKAEFPDARFIRIYMDQRAQEVYNRPNYNHGARFRDDIRYCLRGLCQYVNPQVDYVIAGLGKPEARHYPSQEDLYQLTSSSGKVMTNTNTNT